MVFAGLVACVVLARAGAEQIRRDSAGNLHITTTNDSVVYINGVDVLGWLGRLQTQVDALSAPSMATTTPPTTAAPTTTAAPRAVTWYLGTSDPCSTQCATRGMACDEDALNRILQVSDFGPLQAATGAVCSNYESHFSACEPGPGQNLTGIWDGPWMTADAKFCGYKVTKCIRALCTVPTSTAMFKKFCPCY